MVTIIQFLAPWHSQLGREDAHTGVSCVLNWRGAQGAVGAQRRDIHLDHWGELPGGGDA